MHVLWRDRPYCVLMPHMSDPAKGPGSSCDRGTLMSHTTTDTISPTRIQLQVPFPGPYRLIDSGSDDNFIDSATVSQAHIPTLPLPTPKKVFALDGRLLAHVTHRTAPLSLLLSGNHSETIHLFVISSPQSPLALGLTWLKLHNPHKDWSLSGIVGWSVHCHSACLHSAASSATNKHLLANHRSLL